MYTALRATSETLKEFLRLRFESDANLESLFSSGMGGTMVVSLNNPREMQDNEEEGLSVWLYRLMRDEVRLNAPPLREGRERLPRQPLPVRLHYLITPVIASATASSPETEQLILGKVLQSFHDHPHLRGVDLQHDFAGTEVQLRVNLEPLGLEEITRVFDALDRSYQLSVSYQVSVVNIESARQPEDAAPVDVVRPEYSVIVSGEGG